MSLKWIAGVFLSTYAVVLPGCAVGPVLKHEIELNQRTVQLEGWLLIKGEWNVFPNSDFENYNPYNQLEKEKCVSLVDVAGLSNRKVLEYDRKKVIVKGAPIAYESLPTGTSVSDRLLSKKYFKGEMVENSCLRTFVFAVSGIQVE